jgi:hypothetical protein
LNEWAGGEVYYLVVKAVAIPIVAPGFGLRGAGVESLRRAAERPNKEQAPKDNLGKKGNDR